MHPAQAKQWDLGWWKAMSDAADKGDPSAKNLMEKFHHRPSEELYRVDKDPYKLDNLADKPDFAEVKKRLRAQLEQWMKEQKDPGASMDVAV